MPDPSDVISKITSILTSNIERIEVSALETMRGNYLFRIFNEGRATDGTAIGHYRSKQYADERRKRGRQTQYKDLQFEGDLFNSIKTGTSAGNNVIGFNRDKQRLIAAYQETPRQTGKTVFTPSEEEVESVVNASFREIDILLRNV